jgi:FtsH-binding integral membrane protein
MAERTAERTRSGDGDAESTEAAETDVTDTGPLADETTATGETSDNSYVSVRALIVAFVAIGGGMTLGSLIPIIPFTTFAGIPFGSFLHGLLDRERRYVETAVVGSLLGGLAVVTSLLPQVLAGLDGVRLFAVTAGIGLGLSLVGHYFGRDLRNGLTRDI